MSLTKAQRKALEILRDLPPDYLGRQRTYAAEFARSMWPDSPGWTRVSNVGRGATTGVGIKRAGGAYLARLSALGLVATEWNTSPFSYTTYYSITEKGRKALEEES